MKWYQSLKTHIAAALVLQLLMVMVLAAFSIYQLDLRKHDYAILNLAGQLRVTSQSLVSQSQNYKQVAPRDYESYQRDLNLYHKDLQKHLINYRQIITAFEKRTLPAELTGQTEPLFCNWDSNSISQLDKTAHMWRKFESGLQGALGENTNEPRLEYAADYILNRGKEITSASNELAQAFQIMMETKLDNISRLNYLSIVVFIVINVLLLMGFVYKVFRPLDATRRSFENIANGDLGYQLNIDTKNEIGSLSRSFNSLTQRLAALFRLTDRIHQANNLDDSLKFFHQEFKTFLPIDWVGMVRCVPGTDKFTLERTYTDFSCDLYENEQFDIAEPILETAENSNRPININQLERKLNSPMLKKFKQCGLSSILAIPLECLSDDIIILLLAAKQDDAYKQKHLDLLENISTQLSHSLDKTIGMEGLVISTVEGLAKLAESRDPETGDHLTRMSLYSAIIAEQLSKDSAYSDDISAAYIRDVFRFAPMHDIGKVGIEDSILLKPGKLNDEERKEMERHPVIGAKVLQRCEQQMNVLGHSIFKIGIEIAASHHERYDGNGYPDNLKAEEIPLSARIVAAADVFDALTSKRPYKDAWPVEKALSVMKEESSRHFDPVIIEALEKSMAKIMDIYNQHKHV